MIYITDDKDIRNHLTQQHSPINTIEHTDLKSIIEIHSELIFIVNDRYLKEDETSDFDILVKSFDISKTGYFPRIKKGDILIFKENDYYFTCINF